MNLACPADAAAATPREHDLGTPESVAQTPDGSIEASVGAGYAGSASDYEPGSLDAGARWWDAGPGSFHG